MRACADTFLATETEGAVHGVCEVVTRSFFGVIQRHKASGGKWTFHHCFTFSQVCIRTLDSSGRTGECRPMSINANFTVYSVMDTLNLRMHEASLE